MEGGGFEPPKLSRQIYSLIPLTAREPLQNRQAKQLAKNGARILFAARPVVNRFAAYNAELPSKMELARGVEPPTG